MKIGSLFTGYGGLDMATEAAFDATTAWVSDIDKGACKILAHRYPDVPNLGDITAIDWSTVEPVDIITGGSPCQDLSHAGRRAGMTEGTRSNLWVAMREAIAQLRPKYVVWENVRGAYSAAADSDLEPCAGCVGDATGTHLRALGRVLGDLSDLGYDCQWEGLRAADVGAPHGRFRVFVVAENADIATRDQRRVATPGQATRGRARANAGGSGGARVGSAALGYLDRLESFNPDPILQARIDKERERISLLPTPAVNDMGAGKTVDAWDEWTEKMKSAHGNGIGHGASLSIEALRLLPTPRVANNENRQSEGYGGGKDGNFHELVQDPSRFGKYAAAIARWEPVVGRPAPSPTEPTGRNGAHRLSASFVEWLMGPPAGWVTDIPGITRNEALKACGNGVVPQQAFTALVHMLSQEAAA